MIETVEAYDNLEAILDVPGVGGVFVGPNDLAISHAGSNEGAGQSAKDVEMIERIASECARRGLVAGISCTDGEDASAGSRPGTPCSRSSRMRRCSARGSGRLLASARDPAGPA